LFSVCGVMTEASDVVLIQNVGDVLSVWSTGRNAGRNVLLRILWINITAHFVGYLYILGYVRTLTFTLVVYSRYKICVKPSGLRNGSAVPRLLSLLVRIPPVTWMDACLLWMLCVTTFETFFIIRNTRQLTHEEQFLTLCSVIFAVWCIADRASQYVYMFRAPLCSSSGGQNCIIQHLVSSHCRWPSRAVLCTGWPPTECDETRCCIIQFWPPDDEHIVFETCRGI